MNHAPRSPAKPTARRAVPRLDLSAPQRLGIVAAGSLAALLGVAMVVPVVTGPTATALGRVRAEPVLVRHADGGVVARLAVKEGADVEAGAVIATLDTRLIDSQIAGLKRQMDGIQLHVSGLKQEADALAATDRGSSQRQRLAGLEAQIAASEQESLGLQVRLAMAEQEKARTTVRTPLAGRIVKVVANEAASVLPSGVIAELQPAPDRLVLDATWSSRLGDVRAGQPVSVWSATPSLWPTTLSGRVEQSSIEGAATRVRVVVDLAGTDFAGSATEPAERAFTLQISSGTTSLLATFVAPLVGGASPTRPLSKDLP